MLFSLFKHYLDLYITDTALKVSQYLYCFTISISHSVEKYFPRLWGMGIFDAILLYYVIHCKKFRKSNTFMLNYVKEKYLLSRNVLSGA